MEPSPDPERATPFRSGFIALVGLPNAGKSTLMNALLGEHLSIVTPKAQTTRIPVTGILSEEGVQMVFVDTPGLLEVRDLHQRAMLEAARDSLSKADARLLVVDAGGGSAGESPLEGRLAAIGVTSMSGGAWVVALNKTDLVDGVRLEGWREWARKMGAPTVVGVSARTGSGIPDLKAALRAALPPGPALFPEDQLGVQPLRFFAAEIIRGCLFEQFRAEVPYSSEVRIEEFRESGDPLLIRATVIVERESQKRIIVGAGGAEIRQLGVSSRARLEEFLGARIFLELRVKVVPGWRKKPAFLTGLGYRIPTDQSRGRP